MSIRHIKAVWRAKIPDPQAKLVLLKIADCANEDGICWPFVSTIAEETALSDRTVRRKLEALESAGWLVRERSKNTVTYQIKTPPRGDTLTVPGGDTVTGGDTQTVCHSDRSGVTHRPLGGDTVTATIYREPPRTTIEPPTRAEATADESAKALEIVNAYPRKQKIAVALEIVSRDIRSGIPYLDILNGTKACAKAIMTAPSGALNRYVPSAESFFRDRRWQDDPETIIRKPESDQQANQPQPAKQIQFID